MHSNNRAQHDVMDVTKIRYKVKLVPGTSRRGKGEFIHVMVIKIVLLAAKTAIFKFVQIKDALQHEKDLLKSIKVQSPQYCN